MNHHLECFLDNKNNMQPFYLIISLIPVGNEKMKRCWDILRSNEAHEFHIVLRQLYNAVYFIDQYIFDVMILL